MGTASASCAEALTAITPTTPRSNTSALVRGPLADGWPAVVAVGDLVNVSERPGTGPPIVLTAEHGIRLLVLGRSGRRRPVGHDVGEGWLHDPLVWAPR